MNLLRAARGHTRGAFEPGTLTLDSVTYLLVTFSSSSVPNRDPSFAGAGPLAGVSLFKSARRGATLLRALTTARISLSDFFTMQLAPLALIIAGLASASEEECVCGNDKLQLWGPGGLHTALVPAALLFNVDAPSDQPLLEICWGPEATWREKALECGAGLFAGAEQQMGGFLRVYEAAGADSAAVAPITMQASVLIVPAGNPLGLTGLRDVIDRPELRVVVNDGNFRDSLTSATALWEIVVGRMGSVSATERVRAKIISFAAGSGEARDLILGGDADVWFSWLDWGVANPTGFDFVPIEREFAVARDLGLVPTNRTVEDGLVVGAFIEFLQRSPEANAVMELAGWFKEGALDSPQNMLAARAPAPAPPAVDPLACSVMCGNVTRTGEAWQLCVPGFFQWSLEKSSGVGLASAPLSLKRMEAGGFAGTSFIVPQKVKGKHYQLFYRQSKSMAQGKSWSIWQRLTTAPPNTSTPADLHGPPTCGPVCGDVAFSKAETVAGRDGWQEFCQAGMLKGELEPYNISIGPKTTGLKFPYHLQKLLKMTPGTFGPVEHVLLESEAGNGRMLFRQGLHADGWTAIFQQRFIPALGDNGTAADAAVKTSDDEARVIAASNTSAALTITDFWNGDAHFELISKSAFPEYGMRAMNVGFHFVTRPNGTWFLFHREYNFAPRPEYCIADWARIVVRKSTNQGRNWSDAHPIATPSGPFPSSGNVTDKPQAPDECALTDGSGYYDEKAETWHYLSQCNNRTRHWMLCHYSKKGTDPMAGGLWTINDKNPVVLPGQLWSQICAGGVAAGKACDGAEDGGHGTHDEGTPEIVRSDDKGFHYVTFHGCNDWANRSARGVARTRDFVEWETHGEGLPGDAIFGQVDCNQWNVSGGWADGTCVGGGEGSIIVADDGFMYQLIEAPDVNLGCHTKEGEQNWVLGLLRSKTFSKAGTWEQFGSSGGTSPTVVPYVKEGCFIQYHRLFADDQGTYLEYWAGFGSGWMQIHGLKPGKGTLPIVATDKVLEPWKSDDESPSLTSLLEHDAPGNDGLGIDDGDGADPRGPGNALFCDVAGPACWAPPEEPESTSAAGSPFILLQDSAAAEAYAAGSPGNVSLVPSLSGLWAKRARTAGLATRAVWDISCTALLGCSDTRLEHPQPFPDVARGSPGGLSAVMWVQGRPIHQNDVYATLLNSSTSPHPSGVQASVGSSGEHMELSFLTALAGRPHNITLSTAGCGAASLFDGKAHQVAFLLDGATRLASLMVDDSLCAVSATGWAAWPEGATAANLRHFHATYNERGLVRLRVYPRTLCSSEVLGSFFAGPTTPPALSAGASVHSTRQEVPKLKTDDCFGAATVLRHSIITVFLAPHVSAPTLRSVDLDNALTRALA